MLRQERKRQNLVLRIRFLAFVVNISHMEHDLVDVGLVDEDSLLEILKERERNGNNFVSFFNLYSRDHLRYCSFSL